MKKTRRLLCLLLTVVLALSLCAAPAAAADDQARSDDPVVFVHGLLGWGLTPAYLVGTIFLDYLIPFTVLGFAGAFAKKGYAGTLAGISLVFVLRFISHLFSGAILFGIPEKWADKFNNVWLYSAAYNGSYMLPELVITLIAAAIIFRLPQVKKAFNLK